MLSDTEVAELNEKCAFAMGAKSVLAKDNTGRTLWVMPGSSVADEMPDFCRDAHALGWLVEWLDKQPLEWKLNHLAVCDSGNYGAMFTPLDDSLPLVCTECDTPGEAMASLIIAYAESKTLAEGQKVSAE